ncbi:MAG: hypothetical protein R3E53_07505 [Myxococcota bacterium]
MLEQELRRAGLQVEVLNAGVSGYSNAEALLYLERELLKYDPDLVLLSFFANDPSTTSARVSSGSRRVASSRPPTATCPPARSETSSTRIRSSTGSPATRTPSSSRRSD